MILLSDLAKISLDWKFHSVGNAGCQQFQSQVALHLYGLIAINVS